METRQPPKLSAQGSNPCAPAKIRKGGRAAMRWVANPRPRFGVREFDSLSFLQVSSGASVLRRAMAEATKLVRRCRCQFYWSA
jgi:hypothetical protein